jgi:hypothetical protein
MAFEFELVPALLSPEGLDMALDADGMSENGRRAKRARRFGRQSVPLEATDIMQHLTTLTVNR